MTFLTRLKKPFHPCKEAAIVFIFCLSLSWLYFKNISQAGVFHYDPAYYAIEANIGWDLLTHFSDKDYLQNKMKAELESYHAIQPNIILPSGVSKPTFIWLLSIFNGVSKLKDIATPCFTIIVGLLLVFAVYFLGAYVGSEMIGLGSALLLGISPCHIFLSRTGFANGLAILFFIIGLLLLFENRAWLCGLFMGLSYTSHYGILGNLVVFGACLLFFCFFWHEYFPQATKPTIIKIVCAFFLVLIFWELIYLILARYYEKTWGFSDSLSYFHMAFRQLQGNVPLRHIFQLTPHPLFLPVFFSMTQGWLFLFFLLIAVCTELFFLKKDTHRAPRLFVLAQTTLLTLAWAVDPGFLATRVGAFLLPFYCLTIILALSRPQHIFLRILIFASVAGSLIVRIPKAMESQSGFQDAAAFVAARHPDRILISSDFPQWMYYLGPMKIIIWNKETPPSQWAPPANKTHLALFDYKNFYGNEKERDAGLAAVRDLKPIAVFKNPLSCDPISVYDHADLNYLTKHPEACNIYVYDLAPMPSTSGVGAL